jgi:transmembrane sensor
MTQEHRIPDSLLSQASAWVARRSFGDERDERAFDDWVSADPRHQQAYERVEALINHSLVDEALAKTAATETIRRRFSPAPSWAMAAGLAAVLAGWVALAPVRPLTIASGLGEERTVALADGSSVGLDGDTRLTVAITASDRQITLDHGEAFFDVSHDGRPFTVTVGDARIRVLGTAFDINRTADGAELAVYRGRVSFTAGGRETIVTAGHTVSVVNGTSSDIGDFDPTGQDWRSGWLDTDGITLAHLVERLNRRSAEPVAVADPHLAAREVAGRFKLEDSAALLSGLGKIYGFKLVRQKAGLALVPDAG